MRVGPTESECAHPHDEPSIRGECQRRGDRREIPARKVDVGVGLFEVDVCRHAALIEDAQGFEHPRHPGGGFEVADVALD